MFSEKIPKQLRDEINARFPARTASLREARAEFKRLRGLHDRLRSLERAAHRATEAPTGIQSWECSSYSQNGEDGILMHIFSRIGGSSFRFLEFGCGTGVECNSTNLALGFGWGGLLLDADELNIEKAQRFLTARLGTATDRVEARRVLVTPENINDLVGEATSDASALDLLSIDVDGNDYWIWRAIHGPPARVVVIEYNATFGPERSVTVEFDPGFSCYEKHHTGYYHGASLEALRRLAVARGYQLVGCDSAGVNAFFVLSAIAVGLPSLTSAQAYVPLRRRALVPVPAQFDAIKHLPLIEV